MLHDWSTLPGWDGVHHIWITELLYAIKPLLPPGYRAYVGTTPTFAIGGPGENRPDVGVRDWPPETHSSTTPLTLDDEPDEEIVVASLTLDPAVLVERQGQLVAAIELVSPRNKDRGTAQATYTAAYAGYLLRGVNLLLVDVHRRPLGFSFADRVATELGLQQPSLASPFATAYRVGELAPSGGRLLAVWRRALTVGEPLPRQRLPLSVTQAVPVDLDGTYQRATDAAYLG